MRSSILVDSLVIIRHLWWLFSHSPQIFSHSPLVRLAGLGKNAGSSRSLCASSRSMDQQSKIAILGALGLATVVICAYAFSRFVAANTGSLFAMHTGAHDQTEAVCCGSCLTAQTELHTSCTCVMMGMWCTTIPEPDDVPRYVSTR